MRDPKAILQDACAAITRGDAAACEAALTKFRSEILENPLNEQAREACEKQLGYLRDLAQASLEGLDSARTWMRELSAVLGGLDVYDRGGRQRVATDLSVRTQRF